MMIGEFCAAFREDTSLLVIIYQGLLRMVLRQMCGAGAQVNPDENLMNLLIYCPETFEAFFGIEHERFFNELID